MAESAEDRARRFRAKAEELRTAGETMADASARATMLRMANDYEIMARRLDEPRSPHAAPRSKDA